MSARILLLEDDRELRATLRAALELEGYAVMPAASLADAQAQWRQAQAQHALPDLVLLDLGLPDGDGQDFLAQLRRQASVPVVVISAREAEGQKIRLLDAGADDYLVKPFGVGECWDSKTVIDDWLNRVNATSDNPVRAFDFPLRGRLKDMCDTPGWSLRNLPHPGTLLTSRADDAVTFVENHDIVREHPIVNDKLMAYSFILTHEGYPCVFWEDYFNFSLERPGRPDGIEALGITDRNSLAGIVRAFLEA